MKIFAPIFVLMAFATSQAIAAPAGELPFQFINGHDKVIHISQPIRQTWRRVPTIALISKYATGITTRVAATKNAKSQAMLIKSRKSIRKMLARSRLEIGRAHV